MHRNINIAIKTERYTDINIHKHTNTDIHIQTIHTYISTHIHKETVIDKETHIDTNTQ